MIRVLLADDENLIRSALAALIGLEDDIEVVFQCQEGGQRRPDEVLVVGQQHADHARTVPGRWAASRNEPPSRAAVRRPPEARSRSARPVRPLPHCAGGTGPAGPPAPHCR